ncbi:MAG: Vi polysaccharide biosynthesis UDP-N-acetylglucosamine C-6 dehydrogenase TviB, partial [Tannerella sp.]
MGKKTIAIVGLGYVGLPLAIEFSRKYKVVGYDINEQRLAELSAGIDRTAEVESSLLKERLSSNYVLEGRLFLTSNLEDIRLCQIYIVTVPTPISKLKTPDLSFLLDATKSIAQILKKGDIVVYESTV